jgi:hypothetical protein
MKKARNLSLQLAEIRDITCMETCRRQGEALPFLLKQLEAQCEKLQPSSMKEQFSHFTTDFRRILERGLQLSSKLVGGVVSESNFENGFWTSHHGRGELLDEPRSGPLGSHMEAIFKENRGLSELNS